nr:hypothetical protein CFP56_12296 [Quercus suber]
MDRVVERGDMALVSRCLGSYDVYDEAVETKASGVGHVFFFSMREESLNPRLTFRPRNAQQAFRISRSSAPFDSGTQTPTCRNVRGDGWAGVLWQGSRRRKSGTYFTNREAIEGVDGMMLKAYADEDVIPKSGHAGEEVDLSDETQDFRFLSVLS